MRQAPYAYLPAWPTMYLHRPVCTRRMVWLSTGVIHQQFRRFSHTTRFDGIQYGSVLAGHYTRIYRRNGIEHGTDADLVGKRVPYPQQDLAPGSFRNSTMKLLIELLKRQEVALRTAASTLCTQTLEVVTA